MSRGHLVEEIRGELNTHVGINVQGDGNLVRNNHVVDTGGSTMLGPNASAYGYFMRGTDAQFLNNSASHVTRAGVGLAAGAYLVGVTSGFVVNDRVASSTDGFILAGVTKYRDNLTSNVGAPCSRGSDAGNNH